MIVRAPTHWIGAAAITVWPIVLVSSRLSAWQVAEVLPHERVHLAQQRRWAVYGLGVGLLLWHALYLLCLPVLWNPWRRRREREAYAADGFTDTETDQILRGAPYWLRW